MWTSMPWVMTITLAIVDVTDTDTAMGTETNTTTLTAAVPLGNQKRKGKCRFRRLEARLGQEGWSRPPHRHSPHFCDHQGVSSYTLMSATEVR